MDKATAKQWERRALKAEAELALIHKICQHKAKMEMQMARQLAAANVGIQEALGALQWAMDAQQE